jgi:HAMP domain-containing protein/signal transduction histidine kinase/DNA-binding response OmpR family regulator
VNEDVVDEVFAGAELRAVLAALRALRAGDFTVRLPLDWTGAAGEIAEAFNGVARQNERVQREFEQVGQRVGRDGRLSNRVPLGDAVGGWADAIDAFNTLIGDMGHPASDVARVIGAVERGDLTPRMALEVEDRRLRGDFLQMARTVNRMVDQLSTFSAEVLRVAREVGTEGRLGGQATVPGVAGTWRELTESVNRMAANLTDQVRNISDVTRAVANGDLGRKISVDARGEILLLKETINRMVGQLGAFASETTRVAWEVGTEGKLGGQAHVPGVAGTWKDLTDSVNSMAANLSDQVRNIADVTTAVAKGDLSKKITVDVKGEVRELKDTINTMVDQLSTFSSEVTRVAREVGTEGRLGGQADVRHVGGTWKDLTDSVNLMALHLTDQVRNIAEVTTAIANGDLSKQITVDARGEMNDLKSTINRMVHQLNAFALEVTRVARDVGSEGRLGWQVDVHGVAGTWKDLADSVNHMAANLTGQVRNIAEVTTAVAHGDLSKKITVDARGEILALKNTINRMVDQLNSFASEVTRVAREVGVDGKLGGQANVRGVDGTWKDLADNVNHMAANLTGQVRNIAEVTTAVAHGDLSKKITVDVHGEILELKNTINTMVDQLNSFASEVTRVSIEVGTEGRLGGQAAVEGAGGTWRGLTDSVNGMAANLTGQVRNIVEVTTAVARGDLSRKITVDARGEILELKNTINTMVDSLNSFASEVNRVAREVGTEGRLGGQAQVSGAAGTWKDLTDSVNFMAANLTSQVRNIAAVTTAVANGDLSRKITVDVRGEILELKSTVNTMVDQLNSFASEVTRVSREVGTEGRLGGQATVHGAAGTWKDLTDSVNHMAANLTAQVRDIAQVTTAVATGDLSKKVTVELKGEMLELKSTINTMVDQLNSFASEVTRVAHEVGSEGALGGQAQVRGVGGTWKDLTDNVNFMAANLTAQVRNIAQVTTAVAAGNLSKKITVDARGEILELKDTINTMVDQLNSFASEVSRVAWEVGTEGRLGGQADVRGVAGTWKDLTNNVNLMAANLTGQVRGIATIVAAVAQGDLPGRLVLDARGEIAELRDTINAMLETLGVFAHQIINVAREVGVEGRLGGQASVPGAAGAWRDLTDNVNQLAANLTTQVRSIAEVATAVTKGDLSRNITVAARGEVEALKANINEMIRNLRDTTQKSNEQDWLNSNLARFSHMLQGQRDVTVVARCLLSELADVVAAQQGAFYLGEALEDGTPEYRLVASYAAQERKHLPTVYRAGEGLVGQASIERHQLLVTDLPPDYVQIRSGLGAAPPTNLIVRPITFEGRSLAVLELASFRPFTPVQRTFLDHLAESLGIVLNRLAANRRTEELLAQSQTLTGELQRTNDELAEKAQMLAEQKSEMEKKNRELEAARQALEEKARQLAQSSRYKSEFLANMSHELRTPLNSLLLLARLLADNPEGALSPTQVEYARNIHGAGRDLLGLIDDVLDLSRIEAGKMTVDVSDFPLAELRAFAERSFRPLATEKGLAYAVEFAADLPPTFRTAPRRLQQILTNLIGNAIKFTDAGSVGLQVYRATSGWDPTLPALQNASLVIGFAVTDTGIGIAPEKLALIFEAFQQADMSTSRRYGGTGLGLTISRELARLLGGEIRVESRLGSGSTFTLYLPDAGSPEALAVATGPTPGPTPEPAAPPSPPVSEPAAPAPEPTARPASAPVALVIADDPAHGQAVLDAARAAGVWPAAQVSGPEASGPAGFVAVLRHLPEVVLVDVHLPERRDLLRRLRRHPATRTLPVLGVGGDGSAPLAFAQIPFPVLPGALTDALARARALRARRRVLVVLTPDPDEQTALAARLADPEAEVHVAGTSEELAGMLSGADVVLVDLRGGDALPPVLTDPTTAPPAIVVLAPASAAVTVPAGLASRVRWAEDPDAAAEATAHLVLLRGGGPAAFGDRTVLVVDDEPRNLYALTAVLEREALTVRHATDGREALERLATHPDIGAVLMDLMMPGMNGFEAIGRIRDLPAHARLPVIALTAKAMPDDREQAFAAGASDYLAKPVDDRELVEVLHAWLDE